MVIAENVKGLIQGNAKGYVKQIYQKFKQAGYDCQLFLLNAAFMGVPQRRERTFFVARRRDLGLPKIGLKFDEKPIAVKDAFKGLSKCFSKAATDEQSKWWRLTKPGEKFSKAHPKGSLFNSIKIHPNKPANTLAASGGAGGLYHHSECRKVSDDETMRIQSYPDDYNFLQAKSQYICGMSVPPFMTERISNQIYKQWLGSP